MIRAQNLELLQENMLDLIAYANEIRAIDLNGAHESEVVQQFVQIFTKASTEPLTRPELIDLLRGIQAFIRLPIYTTNQAAAWLGVGIDTVRDAIWRHNPPKLKTLKPGHDVLVPHSELVRYATVDRQNEE